MVSAPYIVVPSQDGLSATIIAAMQMHLPHWIADESDPGTYWADFTASDRIELIIQVNESANAVWAETSHGEAMDRHLRNVSLQPIPGETNAEKRRRYYAQWDALAKDTPDYARALARFANSIVADVDVELTTPSGEEQRFHTWVADSEAQDLTDMQKEDIADYMNAPSRRPLWLRYVMQDIKYTEYKISGVVTYRYGTDDPTEACTEAIEARIRERKKLYTAISISDLERAGYINEDILNVRLTSPPSDLTKEHGIIYDGSIDVLTFTEDQE